MGRELLRTILIHRQERLLFDTSYKDIILLWESSSTHSRGIFMTRSWHPLSIHCELRPLWKIYTPFSLLL